MKIEELDIGCRIKIEGCEGEMVVLGNNWVADLYFHPPSLTQLAMGTQPTHYWNGITWVSIEVMDRYTKELPNG